MKTYSTPALIPKGSVVAMTQGQIRGFTDPDGDTMLVAPGSVGFNL